MAHYNGGNIGGNIGESGVVFNWPTQMGAILGATLVHQVGNMGGIVGTIWVN